jgi:hypothetical protein
MSIYYIINVVYGNNSMIAKYMPNLKKVRYLLWNYGFGHLKRCGIE